MTIHPHHPLRIFAISSILTIALAGLVTYFDGLAGLWIFAILVVLEVTFSFDNAVVNSKVLATMSPMWQKIFLTVGIFIAVFVVRFLLPIVIVMMAGGIGFGEVIDLALNKPDEYSEILHHAAPMIDAFGGAFLLMIGLHYFIDNQKRIHWLKHIEGPLSWIGKIQGVKLGIMLLVATILYFTVDESRQTTVVIASLLGILLHVGLGALGSMFEKKAEAATANQPGKKVVQHVGMAAFMSFVYLEVLDASFSLDGVIGAFAITTSVLLIIAGLGAGAVWVRSLTVYLLRAGTLAKYRYLEHGAHWAIFALGLMMLIKLYHVEPPEWFTGSLGMVFIVTAIVSSVVEQRLQKTQK